MQNYNNITNDTNINLESFQIRKQLLSKLANRFSTYGYRQINTPTFEPYDLYANMNGTVNHDEMIKTIDNTGKVLVLRPDITIPITQQIASNNKQLDEDHRYFYILDVFRQQFAQSGSKESTQAGVEYFGNDSPEADAELIALAIHTFNDLNIPHFKVEIGHSGFFKQLVKELNLESQDLYELKQLIQAKNIPEIGPFLSRLSVEEPLSRAVQEIPLLYGEPREVIERAQSIWSNQKMKEKLQNLSDIFQVLEDYGVADHLVVDLGLINHMDYYSGIIFQGFIENVGKPALMGGRYDRLADQFAANIPAIGFACDINALLIGTSEQIKSPRLPIDFNLLYVNMHQKEALRTAGLLREQNYSVLTSPLTEENMQTNHSTFTIIMEDNKKRVLKDDQTFLFSDSQELMELVGGDFK
ncbi:ATP phosphoribosyltransferase regulatory subunit [Virgibacillus sp. W0181]|uniref:ATP phosphoribosyltransferase regulatory subunit n=1 Tax=Virgibacillus sp. W0181 TaxID=3391581 RepID=UPI003F47FB32